MIRARRDTKTEKLRTQVFAQILRGQYEPGDRIPAEREMAESAGVSRVTVRRAYAELEAAGILHRARGSGTRISTDLRAHGGAPEQVAVVSAQLDRFSLAFISAVEEALRARDVLLVLKITNAPSEEEDAVLDLMRKGVRDMILWPQGGKRLDDVARRLRVLGANLVFFDRLVPGPYADYVGLDNRHAIEALLQHAASHGCRRFVFVGHEGIDLDSDRDRQDAFLRFCRKQDFPHEIGAVPWAAPRRAAIRRLLEELRPDADTAVLCVNDALALAVRECAPDLPRLYGIDGFADPVEDGIVTVRQPLPAMAAKAVSLLFGQHTRPDAWKARRILKKGVLQDGASA